MTAKVILNPYAGRWKALQKRSELESALRDAGVNYDLAMTESPRQAIDLSKEAVWEGFNPIIAAGGDGTSNEVINGIQQAIGINRNSSEIVYGIMPLGSVNDLVENLKLPTGLKKAAEIIARGEVVKIDLGMVIDHSTDQKNVRYFDNNSAVGLEPSITLIQEKITRLSGDLLYITAALIGILRKPEWEMQLKWDDGEYEGLISLVTIGNNPLTGGVFYMTPHADPLDGRLTFVHAFMPTRRKILMTLPKAMKSGSGSYVELPEVNELHTTRLHIKSVQPTPLHTDGEVLSLNALDIEYSILPASLPMLLDVTRLKSTINA